MKPSSLATVLLRLAALYLAVKGVIQIAIVIGSYFYINSLIDRNGPPSTLSGDVFGFNIPVSSVDELFCLQFALAALVLIGGIVVYLVSRRVGNFIGGNLEQKPRQSLPVELQEWKEAAQKDIGLRMFRMFCIDWPSDKPLFDDETGFPVELVDAPDTPEVHAGVAAYNAAMRNWFAASQTG